MIWKGRKSVHHHHVQPWPCVRLIHKRTHLKLVNLNYLSYSSLALENEDEGKMSTVKVSGKPWVSCGCDLSDSSTMEISAQLDLLT